MSLLQTILVLNLLPHNMLLASGKNAAKVSRHQSGAVIPLKAQPFMLHTRELNIAACSQPSVI